MAGVAAPASLGSPLSTRTQGIGNEYEVGKACVCPCMGAITDFPIVWCY